MNRPFRGLFIVFFGVSQSFAIKPATGPQKTEIEGILKEFNGLQDAVKTAEADVLLKEIEVSANPADALLQDQLAELQRKLWVAGRLRDICAGRAIRKTLIAYDIVPLDSAGIPARATGNLVVGPSKGKQAHWYVTTNELEARKGLYKENGEEIRDRLDAETSLSGITTVFPSAFKNPNDLALVLYHEKVHFEQFTTKGRGDVKKDFNEREIEAWEIEKFHTKGFGLTKDELFAHEKRANGKIKFYRQEIELDKFRAKASKRKWQPREPAFIAPQSDEEIAEIDFRSRQLDGIVAEELAAVRRARDRREEERREELARKEKNRLESVGQESLLYLSAGSVSACRRGAVDRTFMNIPMISDRAFYCEHEPKVMSADDSCADRVYGMVMGQLCRSPAFDPEPINDYLRRRPGPGVEPAPPVDGIRPEPEFGPVEASPSPREPEFGPIEASPSPRDPAPAGPDPGPSDDGPDREDRQDRGNRVGDGNGRARDQAGRIGRTGKWPR